MSPDASSSRHRPTESHCLNCGRAIEDAFCPECGQRTDVGPLRLREIAGEMIETLLEFEQPILRTAAGLLVAPGRIASAWVGGKRRRYTNPMKFCVISGVVTTLAMQMFPATAVAAADPALKQSGPFFEATMTLITQYIGLLSIMLAIPLGWIAGLVGRLFRVPRSGIDWYALALYAFGIAVPLQILVALAGPIGQGLSGLLPVIYFVLGAWTFGGAGKRWRSLSTSLISVVLWVALLVTVLGALQMLAS